MIGNKILANNFKYLLFLLIIISNNSIHADNLAHDTVFEDVNSIIKEKVLKVAMFTEDFPPFFFTDKSGAVKGIDAKIAESIANLLGVRVEYIRTKKRFDEVVEQVVTGEAHIAISSLSFTNQRVKKAIYVPPYINLHTSLLVNRSQLENMPNMSLSSIFNKYHLKIATLEGSSSVNVAKKIFPDAEIVQVNSLDNAYNMVAKGECFAYLTDDSSLRLLLLIQPKYNATCFMVVLEEVEDNIHIVVSPKLPNLANMINILLINNSALTPTLSELFTIYEHEIKQYYNNK
jgi:polar amino acid transport system substrate-binding protein